jgi:CheY-like chemotaxis protein
MLPRTVESGPEALEELRAAVEGGEPYPLAVLDMQMPDMDGMELARRIKAEEAISGVRLVMLTSMGRRGDGAQAARAGIEAYLTKPVRQSELYDVLATVVNEDEAGHDGASRKERPPDRRARSGRGEERGAAASPAAGPAARVLLAEDNPVNQKVAVRMLQRLGYEVDVAADGNEALKALPAGDYDAVLMDVQMPGMDGYEATAEIRRREGGYQRTPVIAMTANALEGDREAALEAGMDDYISKPVKLAELEAVLRRWRPAAGEAPGGARDAGPVAEALDAGALENLRELGGPEMLAELAEMFLRDAPEGIARLREALRRNDAPEVERLAHTLKGSSGNMGAARMAEICSGLQASGAGGDLRATSRMLEDLSAEFERAAGALEAEVRRG